MYANKGGGVVYIGGRNVSINYKSVWFVVAPMNLFFWTIPKKSLNKRLNTASCWSVKPHHGLDEKKWVFAFLRILNVKYKIRANKTAQSFQNRLALAEEHIFCLYCYASWIVNFSLITNYWMWGYCWMAIL